MKEIKYVETVRILEKIAEMYNVKNINLFLCMYKMVNIPKETWKKMLK